MNLELKRQDTGGWGWMAGEDLVLKFDWSRQRGRYIADDDTDLGSDWRGASDKGKALAEKRHNRSITRRG